MAEALKGPPKLASTSKQDDGQELLEDDPKLLQGEALLDHDSLHSRRLASGSAVFDPLLDTQPYNAKPKIAPELVARLMQQPAGSIDSEHGPDPKKLPWSVAELVQAVAEQADELVTGDKAKAAEIEALPGRDSEWMGVQYEGGYVVTRRKDSASLVHGSRAALARLLSRRSAVSHPPLIPNSSSRLLIWLVIVCILALGVVTVLLQEAYYRLRRASSNRGRRRPSGQSQFDHQHGRFTLHREVPPSTATAAAATATDVGAASVEEEEMLITTPPIVSRRNSSRSILQAEPDDSDDHDSSRKHSPDLHYFALPLGLGIGYSYAPISDRAAARAKLNKMAEAAARKRKSSQHADSPASRLATSLPSSSSSSQLVSLPLTASKATAMKADSGLRSRVRSFKDLCNGALAAVSSKGEVNGASSASDGSEGEGISSSPATGSSLPYTYGLEIDNDLTPMATLSGSKDYWTSSSTVTAPSSVIVPSSTLHVQTAAKGKMKSTPSSDGYASAVAIAADTAPVGPDYTLIDLTPADLEPTGGAKSYTIPDRNSHTTSYASTSEDGSSSASSSLTSSPPSSASSFSTATAASASVARHPLVEHLRREGRSNGERRVGNGTPTSVKPLLAKNL